jgi:general secretion pathway protein F
MAGFRYEALAATGRVQKGVIESDNARQARAWLREQGLTPVEVEPIAQGTPEGRGQKSAAPRRTGLRRLSASALALITRQLSTLLGAGLTVEQTMNALIEQAESEGQRQLLAAIRSDVLAGQPLARSLANQKNIFPEVYRTLVDAGERSGKLPEVLMRLADYTEDREVLRGKVQLAFIYPALVTLVAICVVTGLLTYVVPQVVKVFQNTNQTLPFLTRAMIWTSDALRHGWPFIIGAIVAVVLVFRSLMKFPATRSRWQRMLLKLPLVGPLYRGMNVARLASTLAILVGSRVPLLTSLKAGTGVVTAIPMRDALDEAGQRVQEGASLSRALAVSKLFPALMVHMIASGEASGRLAEMLERTATQQSRELERRIDAFVTLLEPLMILVMGGVVLVIVLAILLPIFELNQIIR